MIDLRRARVATLSRKQRLALFIAMLLSSYVTGKQRTSHRSLLVRSGIVLSLAMSTTNLIGIPRLGDANGRCRFYNLKNMTIRNIKLCKKRAQHTVQLM